MAGKEHDDWLSSAFGIAADKLRSGAQSVGGALSDAADSAANLAGSAFDAGAGLVDAGESALSSAAQAASAAAAGVAGGAAAGVKKVVAAFIPGDSSGPMAADCKPLRGHVPGPAHHILCQTHGHVLDTKAGQIIAASVEDYKRTFKNGQPISIVARAGDAVSGLIDEAGDALSKGAALLQEGFPDGGALLNDTGGAVVGKDLPPQGFESPSQADQARRGVDALSAVRPTDAEREKQDEIPKEALKKAAEAYAEQFFKTKLGKEIEAKAEKELSKIPPFVTIGVGAGILAAAAAGLAATHGEFPIEESPEFTFIKLGGVPVKVKLTWKGPVDKPKEVVATFSFDIPSGENRPRRIQETPDDGRSSRLEPSGAFKEPRKEGRPVVVANFDHGRMSFSQVLKSLERAAKDAPGGRILVLAFFTPSEAPEDPDAPLPPDPRDAAQAQAAQMRAAIEQMVDRRRFSVEQRVSFKGVGASLLGPEIGTRDMAVVFIPFE